MLCVQFLFWYIAHNWNYGILATPARTIVKTRLNIELHRKVNRTEVHSTNFFDRCPSCVNGFLMKGEYQTMVDSVRECLPLIGRFNGNVKFQRDPLQYEMINDSGQMKFIEGQHLKRGEERFQKLSELGRYGLRLDLVTNSIRKYSGVSSSSIITSKFRSVNKVFNYKSFRLSNFFDVDRSDDFIAGVHSKLRFINNSLKRCNPKRVSKEIRDLELMFQDAKPATLLG